MESVTDSFSNHLSPHVRGIASLVYSEFERLVSRYGEGVVDGIVPIIIQTLEQVDQLHEANEMLQASCAQDELRVESLTSRLDREIKARRVAEERVMVLEDEIAEITMRTNEKLANSTRLVRVLEAKCIAANEHVTRQEAKEAELRRDLANTQKRCNELLCSHAAHVDRVRSHLRPVLTERSSLSESRHVTPEEGISHLDPMSRTRGITQLSMLSSPDNHNIDEPVFDALDETTDYGRDLGEQPPTRTVSEVTDPISEVSDDCDFLGSKSLEAEVAKLLSENQELIEMKQALNILKDDLLNRIEDLSGDKVVLESDLKICRDELAAERERARRRECQLVRRIQHLISQQRAAEKFHEGGACNTLVRCVSLDPGDEHLTVQALQRRRTHSCPAALPAIDSSMPQKQQSLESTRASPERVRGVSSGTLRLTKREVERVLVERNYYKEHYLDAKNRLCDIENACQAQHPFARMRKREMASILVSRIFQSVHNFASDVAQGFDELITPVEAPAMPLPPSRTSTALWNLLGNFVGQAVTYTADAVIGTGSDLPLDVSRPVIAANINSRLPIVPPPP